jgi:hypothetical protein
VGSGADRLGAHFQQLTQMEGAVDTDPELAIGKAKEFVESICKTILDERNVEHDRKDDLPTIVKKTTKALHLTTDDISDTAKAADTIKKMLNNLGTIVQGSAELRNAYGTGHGKSKSQAKSALTPRHARLAVGAARRSASSCSRRTRRAGCGAPDLPRSQPLVHSTP